MSLNLVLYGSPSVVRIWVVFGKVVKGDFGVFRAVVLEESKFILGNLLRRRNNNEYQLFSLVYPVLANRVETSPRSRA